MKKLTDCFSELYIEKEFTLSVCRDGVILSLSPVESTLVSWKIKDADSLLVASKEISSFLRQHREHRFHPLYKSFRQITKENSNNVFENMYFVIQNGLFGNTKIFDKYEGNFRGENVVPFKNFSIWTENCRDFQEKTNSTKEIKNTVQKVQNEPFLKTRDNKPLFISKVGISIINWFKKMKWALIFFVLETIIFVGFMRTNSEELGKIGIIFGLFIIAYCLFKILEELLLVYLDNLNNQNDDEDKY